MHHVQVEVTVEVELMKLNERIGFLRESATIHEIGVNDKIIRCEIMRIIRCVGEM
jgi:hypothetical protein